jgi:hypothetical protein
VSEQAPEAPARTSGGGNPLTRKLGPLPLWGWLGIATALALVYVFISKGKSSSASAATTGAGTAAGATSVNSPGGVDSSLVPQFVNQTFNESTPPVTNITDSGNTVTAASGSTVNTATGGTATSTSSTGSATSKPPTTISATPGSYTTSLGTGYDEWTSTGKYSLNTLAKSHGMTAQQLIAASESQTNNTALKAYVSKGNYNANVPAGTLLFIPTANWKVT